MQWATAKEFSIFKIGHPGDPANYHGISTLIALAKLYHMILSVRFHLWYKPKVEQARTQPGRGCEEPILTIRLFDIARKCGLPEGV